MRTKFYALTGGIGSGKSTLADMFKGMGIPVLDLDQVGHIILQQDKQVQHELVQAFGQQILEGQSIDRSRLAEHAFASQQTTQTLNDIMHPRIQAYEETWRSHQTTNMAIIEASVLIESGGASRMDGLLVILCDTSLRWQRVKQRGNQNESRFQQIIKQQCSDQARIAHADFIFDNNRSLEHLKSQAIAFMQSPPR